MSVLDRVRGALDTIRREVERVQRERHSAENAEREEVVARARPAYVFVGADEPERAPAEAARPARPVRKAPAAEAPEQRRAQRADPRRWLRDPRSLRDAIVLREILGSPVALRRR